MFGHIKAADFVNLMEAAEVPAKQRTHMESCPQCRATWESMQSIHAEISSLEADIAEPDWAQFRSSVRDELLSRSVQRESAVRRWTGWAIRPAVAWALSLLLIIGLTTVAVLWNTGKTAGPSGSLETPVSEPSSEVMEAVPEKALFD